MEKWMALNNQTSGRDKIARLVQYLSRTIWDTLEKNEINPALVDHLKTLEFNLSSFRKILCFGRCIESFYSSLKTIHYPDMIIRMTLTFSKLASSLCTFADHMIWLSRTGFFKNINAKKWGDVANKYWLLSIIMNLVRDLYEIFRLIDLHRAAGKCGITKSCNTGSSRKDLSQLMLRSYICLNGHKDIVVDTMKNVCDVFIPLTGMGYIKLSPRTIGLLGAISSAAGLVSGLVASAKLVPA